MTILDEIISYKKDEVNAAKANASEAAMRALALEAPMPRGFIKALKKKSVHGIALIAEIKKASPSKGLIREDFDPAALAKAYEKGGATCLSVLTDFPSFKGSPEALKVARDCVALPILRKDFMIDPYQVLEARAWGADCILLIMACLTDDEAHLLAQSASEYALDVLVEVHDEEEMIRALELVSRHQNGDAIIGINNRNLKTFETDLESTEKLISFAATQMNPGGRHDLFIVSESGINTNSDIHNLVGSGAKAFLVGETLMRQQNVSAATAALIQSPQIV
ncbi:MAG: indole-3-glycerol phosphate synthase TrpC [Pseudomonadota bacterium]